MRPLRAGGGAAGAPGVREEEGPQVRVLARPAADPATPSDRSGFTLVELLAVLVIISVVAALALPSFSGARGRARVDDQVAAVLSLARRARARAVHEGRAYLVVIDPEARELRLRRQRDPLEAPSGDDDPELALDEDASWSRPLPFQEGVELEEVELAGELAPAGPWQLEFDPAGRATAARLAWVGADGTQRVVEVEPTLGLARVTGEAP